MRNEPMNTDLALCHACGVKDTATSRLRKPSRACAYCGARKKNKSVDNMLDKLLSGE